MNKKRILRLAEKDPELARELLVPKTRNKASADLNPKYERRVDQVNQQLQRLGSMMGKASRGIKGDQGDPKVRANLISVLIHLRGLVEDLNELYDGRLNTSRNDIEDLIDDIDETIG